MYKSIRRDTYSISRSPKDKCLNALMRFLARNLRFLALLLNALQELLNEFFLVLAAGIDGRCAGFLGASTAHQDGNGEHGAEGGH